jgi:3-keto-L-gulonate-6-phosphate decarboxylase
MLIAGSSVYGAPDPAQALRDMRRRIDAARA